MTLLPRDANLWGVVDSDPQSLLAITVHREPSQQNMLAGYCLARQAWGQTQAHIWKLGVRQPKTLGDDTFNV